MQLRRDTDERAGERVNPLNPDEPNHPAGVSFHWDKDESLVDAYGVNVHPAVSTVTYLGDAGAPTFVADKTPPVMYEELEAFRGAIGNAVLSHPETGKHLSFDGRMLHGAPRAAREGSGLRVTFSRQRWLGHKPADVEPFPEEALGEFREASRGDEPWVRVARAMEEKIRRDAAPPRRRADVGGGAKTRRRRGGRRDPKNHPKNAGVRVRGDGHGARAGRAESLGEGATEGGTVAFRFASGSGCAVVEHPSRRRRRSARLKTGS